MNSASTEGPTARTAGGLSERFVISSDPSRLDRGVVHRWLTEGSYWATGRARDVNDRALENSLVYAVFDEQGAQVAVARIVTDRATFAWICDVFVDDMHRGLGIGTWLTETIVAELRHLGVDRFLLATRDAHGVYARAGFRPVAGPQRFMEIDERPSAAAIVAFVTSEATVGLEP